jgi:hypothetical protein
MQVPVVAQQRQVAVARFRCDVVRWAQQVFERSVGDKQDDLESATTARAGVYRS